MAIVQSGMHRAVTFFLCSPKQNFFCTCHQFHQFPFQCQNNHLRPHRNFFLGHTQVIYLGSKALHIIGVWDSKIIGTMHCDQLVIWSSVHLLLHQVDFICLVRPRLAEGETWLDSSRWGIAVQLRIELCLPR